MGQRSCFFGRGEFDKATPYRDLFMYKIYRKNFGTLCTRDFHSIIIFNIARNIP